MKMKGYETHDTTKITIYDIAPPLVGYGGGNGYSMVLIEKMNTYARANNINAKAMTDSIKYIDETGQNTDIILLGPECRVLESEIKPKFPNKVVKVLDIEDYGKLKAEKILKMALSLQDELNAKS